MTSNSASVSVSSSVVQQAAIADFQQTVKENAALGPNSARVVFKTKPKSPESHSPGGNAFSKVSANQPARQGDYTESFSDLGHEGTAFTSETFAQTGNGQVSQQIFQVSQSTDFSHVQVDLSKLEAEKAYKSSA